MIRISRHKRRWLQNAVICAAFCTILLRAAIPAGWMPTIAPDGMMRITLCTGMGVVDAWIDETGRVHRSDPDEGGENPTVDQPCTFSALAAPVTLLSGIVADTFSPHAVAERVFVYPNVAVGLGLAAPPPPQIGPPAAL